MTRRDLVDRCKAVIQEAYEDATELIVAYLELNPDEPRDTLCKEIDPDNWNALRQRVKRAQASRKAGAGAELARSRALRKSRVRHARSALREAGPEELAEVFGGLSAEKRAEVVRAAVPPPQKTPLPRTGPSFIELVVRINGALIELEGMVAGWGNLAAVPDEFSRDSFSDIVAKALRIQDRFDALGRAIDEDDEDEFLEIVRNFRVVDDVR